MWPFKKKAKKGDTRIRESILGNGTKRYQAQYCSFAFVYPGDYVSDWNNLPHKETTLEAAQTAILDYLKTEAAKYATSVVETNYIKYP